MKHSDIKMDKKTVKKAVGMHDKQMHGGKKTNLASLKKGGMTKSYAPGGSLDMVEKDGKKVPFYAADGVGKMACGGKVRKMACGGKVRKMAVGGMSVVGKDGKSKLLGADSKYNIDKVRSNATSEGRLARASKSQMDSNIGPNLKSKRARSDGGLQAEMDEPKQSFGDAFKAARKSGKDKFTYNGKSYTTETAAEKSKAKAKDTETDTPTPTGNIGSRVMFEEGETGPAYKRGGMTKMSKGGCAKMAKGGGIEKKGKTRGRII